MQRYFAKVINDNVFLLDEDIHHLLHVMRMKSGDQIEVCDQNNVFLAEVKSTSPLQIKIVSKLSYDSELEVPVTLFFALAKGDKIDFVVQKACELGVSKVVLIKSKRCVVNFDNKDINKKLERYNKIAKEASQQCHRQSIPEVIGVYDIEKIPSEYLCQLNYVAYEKDAGDTNISFNEVIKNINSISILIGPEGGLEINEIDKLVERGFKRISLGKRILRTETAALYSLSVIGYLLEK